MASLRKLAECLGLPGNFTLVHHFYGYNAATAELSLLRQISRIRRQHVHLNIIRVGFDSLPEAEEADALREVDAAIQVTRDVYATVGLGVGRVEQYFIPVADAKGFEHVNGDGEAEDLADQWSVDNDAIDVFFVLTYGGSNVGSAPKPPGSCDKDDKGAGVVMAIEASDALTATVLAHETGHYLGLDHVDDSANLMDNEGGRDLTSKQGAKMRKHCFVQPGCED